MKITRYILCAFCTLKTSTHKVIPNSTDKAPISKEQKTHNIERIEEHKKQVATYRQQREKRKNEKINEFITSKHTLRTIPNPTLKEKEIMIDKCEKYRTPTYDEKNSSIQPTKKKTNKTTNS